MQPGSKSLWFEDLSTSPRLKRYEFLEALRCQSYRAEAPRYHRIIQLASALRQFLRHPADRSSIADARKPLNQNFPHDCVALWR